MDSRAGDRGGGTGVDNVPDMSGLCTIMTNYLTRIRLKRGDGRLHVLSTLCWSGYITCMLHRVRAIAAMSHVYVYRNSGMYLYNDPPSPTPYLITIPLCHWNHRQEAGYVRYLPPRPHGRQSGTMHIACTAHCVSSTRCDTAIAVGWTSRETRTKEARFHRIELL